MNAQSLSPAPGGSPTRPRHTAPDAAGWLTYALIGWLGICVAWLVLRWGGATAEKIFGLYYDVPIGPILAYLCWRVARQPNVPTRTRQGWRLLAVAFVLYWLGNCIWNYYEGVLEIDPFPSVADVFFLAFYPLAIYGLTCLTGSLPTPLERRKFALDCATATISVFGLLWYFGLHHVELDFEHGSAGALVSVAYPAVDVMLLIAIVSAILKRRSTAYVAPLLLLLASASAMLVGDILFLVPALEDEYTSGGLVDGFFMASFGLAAAAAQRQLRLAGAGAPAAAEDLAAYSYHLFPYIAVGAVYALLLWEHRQRWSDLDGILTMVSVAITALVVIRQILANRENAELSGRQAAHVAEARYTALVRNSSDVVLVVDDRLQITFASLSVYRVLGVDPDALCGRSLLALVHPDDVYHVRHFCRDLIEDAALTGPVEWRFHTSADNWCNVEVAGSNLYHEQSVQGLVLNARDVTERKRLEDQLKHMAFTDTLTLLANRNLFNEQLALALAHGNEHEPPTLIFVDLDNFKKINDSLGHEAGDKLLAIAARRLVRATRSEDVVARLGGDEFALLIGGDAQDGYARGLAGRLIETLSAPYDIGGRQFTLSASLGVAKGVRNMSAQELMRNADLAMYRAKSCGKNCFEIYEPSLYVAVIENMDLEADMVRGLDNGEFVPCFQPIVDLKTLEIVGVEALARWQHPTRGLLDSGAFIQIAEDSGLIDRLGRAILFDSGRYAAHWLANCDRARLRHLAVNISGRQIEHSDLVSDVNYVLEQFDLPPQSLVLEVTENVLMQNVPAAVEKLSRLKDLGVRIALDNFGTGYSSLSHVHRFPIDMLKIDRSFIASLGKNDGAELVRAIISLANALDLEVVAEGVERLEQQVQLQALGCAFAQGYYFARAEAPDVIEQMLRSPTRLPRLSLVRND